LKQLVDSFASLTIEAAPPPTDASPQQPSPLAELPEEILTQILQDLAIRDVAAFARMAQVCKRLAYLVLNEESIWKRVALGSEVGFGAMHYDYACDIAGFSLEANDSIARYLDFDDDAEPDAPNPSDNADQEEAPPALTFTSLTQDLLRSTYASSYRQMFRSRPRIRFNGCYISTVNYTRPGAASSNTLTWGAPVHMVTYFRYLRFFRDGSAISLLTTTEPGDVVHHLTKENMHSHHGVGSTLPSAVMRDALRGRWRLSSPISSAFLTSSSTPEDVEAEGDIFVKTEGVVPKYTYKMQLGISHAGKSARNNKLAWKGFWSYNRLTDDWGEFGLKNDRAFYWSRVRSFG
jgi:F-box protein 9